MSILAGRLAGKEGAYFFQESKQAVSRLAAKTKSQSQSQSQSSSSPIGPDILPEIHRHSLPLKRDVSLSVSSNYSASKWALPSDSVENSNAAAINPLTAYVSMPQVTFGPKRWQIPEEHGSIMASTANDLRRQRDPLVADPQKLEAMAQGFTQIGKAFAAATVLVFGGATLIISMAVSKLELKSGNDIRTKVRDIVEPKHEMVKKQLEPIKEFAESMSKKWHYKEEGVKEKRIAKELTKIWGAKSSK